MLAIYFYTIISVLIISLLSLIGIFTLILSREKLNKLTLFLVSLSAGTLLGDSFLHLIPEAVAKNGDKLNIWLWLLFGILTFFILEKVVHWRHCHLLTTESHPHPVGMMNLVGGGMHNFIDGMVIAGSYLIDFNLGLATTIAVISHEIPRELGDFAILIYAGYTKFKALFYNFISAAISVAGAIFALIIGGRIENFSSFIVPFTAGGFIYIATSDLFPELKKDNEKLHHAFIQLGSIIIGIGIMLILKIINN
jgi:zinc and cadmium transporter